MFVKKLLVRLSVIILIAGITAIGFALEYEDPVFNFSDPEWLYAGVKKSKGGDSTTHSIAKGKSLHRKITNGKANLNAFAPGGKADPDPLVDHQFNGLWNDRLEAWGHNNSSEPHGASSSVSGTDKYGKNLSASAST